MSDANHQKPSITMKPLVQDSPPIMTCPSLLAQMFSSWVQQRVGVWVWEQTQAF